MAKASGVAASSPKAAAISGVSGSNGENGEMKMAAAYGNAAASAAMAKSVAAAQSRKWRGESGSGGWQRIKLIEKCRNENMAKRMPALA